MGQSFILPKSKVQNITGEVLKSQYQKELFSLNVFPKNKQNKLRQIKEDEMKQENLLNYTTIIKYAFCFLFRYFSPNKLAKHILKMCLFCFHLLIYSQFFCHNHSTKGAWVFLILILMIYCYFLQINLCFILDLREGNNKHNCVCFKL